MNVVSVGVLMFWLYTFGTWYFDLDTFPEWAVMVAKNTTKIPECVVRNNTG